MTDPKPTGFKYGPAFMRRLKQIRQAKPTERPLGHEFVPCFHWTFYQADRCGSAARQGCHFLKGNDFGTHYCGRSREEH